MKFNRVCQLTRPALLPALGALLLVLPGFRAEAAAAARFALRTPGAVTSMDISSNGRQLLTVSTGRAYIWDLPSGRFIRPIQAAPCALQNAGFSSDGLHIFSRRRDCDQGSGARELPLYRIFSGVLETRLHRTSGRLTAIAYADFSTNGQNRPDFLATADNG
ncbi:MAG: WD40 repeat domain-containing protein, partial [Leptospiraceae bacterium]|nr:WD40 repeat domain-containing protein [Leptospiraceae bacterium]